MEFLTGLFAEDVTPLLWVIALAELILVIALFGTGRGRLLVFMIALIVLAAALFGLEQLLVTDRERIDGVVDELKAAVEREDADSLVRHLSEECRYGQFNRDAIQRVAENVFRNFEIDRVGVSDRKTKVLPSGKEATAEFLAVARGKEGNTEYSPYPTRWILSFRQTAPGTWQVTEIQQLPAMGESRQPLPPRTAP